MKGDPRPFSAFSAFSSIQQPFEPAPVESATLDPRLRADDRPIERRTEAELDPRWRGREPVVRAREKDQAAYRAAGQLPWVTLGEPGYLRDQRYVPVTVRADRWNPSTGQLEISPGYEIRLHFEGGRIDPRPNRVAEADSGDPFTSVYAETFLNREQAPLFRRQPTAPAIQPAAAASGRSIGLPRYELTVREEGPVRIDFDQLSAAGFAASTIDSWRLENQGVQIPLRSNDDGDGVIEPGEWVQFYGQPLTNDSLPELNTDFPGTDTDLFVARDFTDINIYTLTVDTPGQPLMSTRNAAPAFIQTPPTEVPTTLHLEVDDAFRPLGGADAWYWLPTLTATVSPSRTDSIDLPGLVSGQSPLQLRVQLRGASESLTTNPDHDSLITLLNQSNQTLTTDSQQFDGRTLFTHSFGWSYPGSGPEASDPIKLSIEAIDIGGGERNDIILDYIEVDYLRQFVTTTDHFEFVWPDGDAEFVIDGFSASGIVVWEITDRTAEGIVTPVRLSATLNASTGPTSWSTRFRMDNDPMLADGTPRRFLAFRQGGVSTISPTDFNADSVSDLRDQMNQADLIVLAHSSLVDLTPGSPLDQLLAHRATPAGGGFTSKVVLIEDVEDEFNYGLPGPVGIREFLRWVLSSAPGEGWSLPKPTHLLILGDGTFDYKGREPAGNFVPTQIVYKDVAELGYYASDNLLATVVGSDQLADLVVGRLPARTLTEAEGYLQKILDYELLRPSGPWQQHAVTVADRGKTGNNPGEALQFEMVNEAGIDELATGYTSRQLKYWTDILDAGVSNPIETMRQEVKDAVNGADGFDGAALLQFAGHGNFVVWSDDAFFDERNAMFLDTDDLTNGLKLPWIVVHNCLSGGFHTPLLNTMGEDWLRRSGGGAAAVYAPSGLSFNFVGLTATTEIWSSLFGSGKARDIATPILSSLSRLCGQGSVEACQQYVLLGDPATQLQIRSVEPISGASATAGSLEVTLDWDPSPDAASYRIVRTEFLDPPFFVSPPGSTTNATSYTDSSVVNGTTYYYAIIAVDSEGFESAWSHRSTDCLVSGPDCLPATPTNPDPPAVPSIIGTRDPGLGDRVIFDWVENAEADLAYYTVQWGAGSGNPQQSVQVTLPTFTALGLLAGSEYCATISATNTSGKSSANSAEFCDSPSVAPGVRRPRYISDLRVDVAGADIALDWSSVSEDIYGKQLSVQKYEVLRGVAPDYTNATLTAIGECFAPCSSFVDTGAAQAPQSYHYRVRAIEAGGLTAALGSETPEGVELEVYRSGTPGDISLIWSPSLLTYSGEQADIDHYAVFASDQPISASEVLSGALTPIATTPGLIFDLTPPVQPRFYSVFAVDRRGNMSPY